MFFYLFFLQNIFCQEYLFDTFLEYNKQDGTFDIFMMNSASEDYVYYCYNNKPELKGKIVDKKRNVHHYYVMKKNDNLIDFEYLYSKKIDVNNKDCFNLKNEKFEINTIVLDSMNQSIEVIEYTNKKKKKVYKKGIVNLKKIDSNNLPTIAYGYFTHFSNCIHKIVSFPKGYIPLNIKINYENDKQSSINITQNKKINTLLSLKQEQINYKQ